VIEAMKGCVGAGAIISQKWLGNPPAATVKAGRNRNVIRPPFALSPYFDPGQA
jgi:hypothetical protein